MQNCCISCSQRLGIREKSKNKLQAYVHITYSLSVERINAGICKVKYFAYECMHFTEHIHYNHISRSLHNTIEYCIALHHQVIALIQLCVSKGGVSQLMNS